MMLLFLGCASSMLGTWDGVCEFDDGNTELEMDVTARIDRDNGYVLEGAMDIVSWDEQEFTNDLTGDHSGKYVMLRSNFETDLGPYKFRVESEKVGQELEGDCIIQAPDSVGALIGEINLVR